MCPSSRTSAASSRRLSANHLRLALGGYLTIAILSSVGLLGKAPLIARLLRLPALLAITLITMALLVPLAWRYALRMRAALGILTCLGLLVAFFAVFPRIDRHIGGRGTDQPDCVIVAARHMAHGTWPYDSADLWTGNPMSCGPGWVAMQTPATATAGYPANMLLLWGISFAAIGLSLGWAAAMGVLALLALAPAFWLAAANGSDFLTFGIATAAWVAVCRRPHQRSARIFLAVVGALLGEFRMATLLLPAFFTRRLGRLPVALALFGSLAIEIGFLLWNTPAYIARGPMHILFKLTHEHMLAGRPLPAAMELALPVVLAGAALIAGSRLYASEAALAAYFAIIFVAPAALDLVRKHQLYGNVPDMLQYWEGSLWLMACLPLLALLVVENRRRAEPDPAAAESR